MPRKKPNPTEAVLAEIVPTVEPEPKKPRTRAAKSVAPVETAPETPKRSRKPKAPAETAPALEAEPERTPVEAVTEPSPHAEAKPKSRSRAKAKTPEAAPVTEPEPKPKRVRKPKAVTPAVIEEVLPLDEPEPEPAPTSEGEESAPSETTSLDSASTAIDLGDGRELAVTFRPKATSAARTAEVEAAPTPVSDDAPPAPEAVRAPDLPDSPDDEPLPTVTFRARPSAGTKSVEAVEPPPTSVERPAPLDLSDEEMPLISWRPRGTGSPTARTEVEADVVESSDDRGRRRRGRGDREDAKPRESAENVVAAATPKPASQPIVKPPLAIPPDAPQIVLRSGVPVLVRDGRAFPPLAFGGDPAAGGRAEATTLDQIRLAAADGVHLHVLRLPVEVDANAVESVAARASDLLAKVGEADPQAQTILFVEFQAPRDVERRFPDALYTRSDGRPADPSVCDDGYWGEAQKTLRGLIERIGSEPRLMGFQLDRGWDHPEEEGYDTSRAAERKFRAWARTRYGGDVVALRAAWFDGAARFEDLTAPTPDEASQSQDRFIRAGRRQRRVVDYHLFLSDATAARLGELAAGVKEASGGCLLVGVDYGATLEGVHPAGGHLALGKVMRTPEIDFVSGPPSYTGREAGGSAAFPSPVDSFPLNGKLYLSVEDYRTSLGGSSHPGEDVLRTPQALESVHWRGVGAALAHGMGLAWTDAMGEGSLRTHSVWDRATKVREALTLRMAAPMEDPEVAVFIDERALAYLVDGDAFELLVQGVRESILRAGVSAAFYLLSDLAHREKFPDSKLYVFLNAWDIRPESRAAIKSRLQRDGKVLFWVYAAGLFDAGRDSLERAREVTGIALKPQPFASRAGTTLLNRRHPLTEAFAERTLSGNAALEPTYFAIPEDATVLGEYTQTGLPSFVVRDFGGGGPAEGRWTSVFLGEPHVTPALIRALAQMAGAHVWDFSDDVVHVRPPFLTVHCKGTGGRTIAIPDKESAYDLTTREWASVEGSNLRFIGVDGATHCFLVGPRAEIEHLLATDPESVLRVESVPPRELNVRQDVSDFDVPIMKLGEFITSGEGDEVADEWFLRPNPEGEETEPAPAQAAESPDQVGKRRRRRGRGGRDREERASSAAPESPAAASDDFGISVVFRKRS